MSDQNATGINDAGETVGQWWFGGQEQPFEMTPDAFSAPSPPSC
jgi:hypothetical protein